MKNRLSRIAWFVIITLLIVAIFLVVRVREGFLGNQEVLLQMKPVTSILTKVDSLFLKQESFSRISKVKVINSSKRHSITSFIVDDTIKGVAFISSSASRINLMKDVKIESKQISQPLSVSFIEIEKTREAQLLVRPYEIFDDSVLTFGVDADSIFYENPSIYFYKLRCQCGEFSMRYGEVKVLDLLLRSEKRFRYKKGLSVVCGIIKKENFSYLLLLYSASVPEDCINNVFNEITEK